MRHSGNRLMGKPPKCPCKHVELLWWVLATIAQHPHTHTCTIIAGTS